jgi:hypothetical protein
VGQGSVLSDSLHRYQASSSMSNTERSPGAYREMGRREGGGGIPTSGAPEKTPISFYIYICLVGFGFQRIYLWKMGARNDVYFKQQP